MDDFFVSDDEYNDFNFKYVPTNQFKYIVKNVRRQRTRQDEERIWASFVQQQEQKGFDDYHVNCFHNIFNAKQVLRDNLVEIDQELKRLEEDALPEQSKRLNDYEVPQLDNKIQKDIMAHNNETKSSSINCVINDDASINTLSKIPEEDHAPLTVERSPISQLNFITKSNKLRYKHIIKNDIKRPHVRNLNCRECNSNPEFISHNDSDGCSELEGIRPHPIVAHKILEIQAKISGLLDEIFYRLCRIPPPDGDVDLKRRQQRVMEFSIRFSRNYLYELGRQVSDLQRHVQTILQNTRRKSTKHGKLLHMQVLEQKLYATHQLLVNALNAYCKHIPSSISKGYPGKLKDILQIVIDVKDICTEINLTTEYFGGGDIASTPLGKDTQKRCYAILSKICLNSDNESALFSHSTQSTLIGIPVDTKRRNKQMISRKSLLNRFSMYSAVSKPKYQRNRRPVTVGMYLTENRPLTESIPMSNPSSTIKHTPHNLTNLKSGRKTIRCDRRLRTYENEDEIRTMMDSMPTDSEAESSELLLRKCYSSMSNVSKIMMEKDSSKLRQREKYTRPTTTSSKQSFSHANDDNKSTRGVSITDEHLSSLIPVIADIMTIIARKQKNCETDIGLTSVELFLESLHEYLMSKNEGNSDVSMVKSAEEYTKNLDRKYMRSSSSLEINQGNISLGGNENSPISVRSHTIIQYKEDKSQHNKYGDCESRELVVSDTLVDEILNYRNELSNYQRCCRSSPMYTSNSLNKPWDVIAWIAEKLVDELIAEISKEFQMEDVIRNMFDLEFQEF